jgi:4-amino-4-deoxy-L-arabinose transferase-like glycosyltransferase
MKNSLAWLIATHERRVCMALLMLCAIVYVPLAGNYGMWDPWETHYGEVARQMLERNDFVSLWWPGSPQDRMEFWSKPVLTFWVMALSMKLGGLEWGNPAPSQIADSWRVEWASRIPFVLLGILGIWAVWELVRRLAGARAALLSAVVLATSSQWLLISRQAMTDMPFVVPMTVALAYAGLALLLPEAEREAALERRSRVVLGRTVSWPHAPAFYGFLALFVISTLPQLIVMSSQLHLVFRVGATSVRLAGVVAMLPYFAAFFFGLWWCARARNKRQLYLFTGYLLCALASLAKGPAGVALPALVLLFYLVLAGRWRDIIFKLEIPRGLILFIACCFPWYHAMLIRHGMGFWNEFIGDNYVHRAGGRHGDRGTFEYYVQYVGYGMFPWSGIVTLAALLGFRPRAEDDPRRGLVMFAMVWFVVEFTIMSLVNTKFHHYILPALPALAILAGVMLDEVLRAPARVHALGLWLLAVPVTLLCGRDLAAFPPRILWMFNYDYVNMPGTGRPWPVTSIWGDRYEYGTQILIFAVVATLATAALAWFAMRQNAAEPVESVDPQQGHPYRKPSETEAEAEAEGSPRPTSARALQVLGLFAVALVAAIASGPRAPGGAAPTIARSAWMLPTLLMLPFVWVAARALGAGAATRRASALWAVVAVAVVWSGFLVDKLLVELSPHWSQKHVIASYYAKRNNPDEPLIAWQLYWRGENFYTRNAIYASSNPDERTVFLGDHNAEKMQAYFAKHAGRRVFFVVERTRYESLRALLPAAARSTLTIVDETNNKIYLAVASI